MNSEIDIDVVVIISSWRHDGTRWTCSESCLSRRVEKGREEEVSLSRLLSGLESTHR